MCIRDRPGVAFFQHQARRRSPDNIMSITGYLVENRTHAMLLVRPSRTPERRPKNGRCVDSGERAVSDGTSCQASAGPYRAGRELKGASSDYKAGRLLRPTSLRSLARADILDCLEAVTPSLTCSFNQCQGTLGGAQREPSKRVGEVRSRAQRGKYDAENGQPPARPGKY